VQDGRQHRLGLKQRLSIGEAHHVEAMRVHRSRASIVSGRAFREEVLAAIQLDDEIRFNASEVSDMPSNRMLASKLVA